MGRPRLLDLFCCEGGASEGYRRAGFDVYGVDLFKHTNDKGQRVGFSRSRYPFPAVQGDVFEVVGRMIDGVVWFGAKDGKSGEWLGIGDFAAIHASPPCQHASAGMAQSLPPVYCRDIGMQLLAHIEAEAAA